MNWFRRNRPERGEGERAPSKEEKESFLEARRRARMIFNLALPAEARRMAFNVPYDTHWLRAVVEIIRAKQMLCAEEGARYPITAERAAEMAARYAELGELEKEILKQVDQSLAAQAAIDMEREKERVARKG